MLPAITVIYLLVLLATYFGNSTVHRLLAPLPLRIIIIFVRRCRTTGSRTRWSPPPPPPTVHTPKHGPPPSSSESLRVVVVSLLGFAVACVFVRERVGCVCVCVFVHRPSRLVLRRPSRSLHVVIRLRCCIVFSHRHWAPPRHLAGIRKTHVKRYLLL